MRLLSLHTWLITLSLFMSVVVHTQLVSGDHCVVTVNDHDAHLLIGGLAPCAHEKANSKACVDTSPSNCPGGTTIFCAADPNDAGMCVQHHYQTHEQCVGNGPNGSGRGFNCDLKPQTFGCIKCKRGAKVNGACPESTCVEYGTCGEKQNKPETTPCEIGT